MPTSAGTLIWPVGNRASVGFGAGVGVVADRGVTVLGVHYTGEQWPKSVPDALSFVRAAHLTYPVLPDDGARIATAFGIRGIPSTVIVDESGEMRFRVLGPLRRQVLDDLVDEVLGGRATP